MLLAGIFTFPATGAGSKLSSDSLEASLKLVSNPEQKLSILIPLAKELANSDNDKGAGVCP